MVCFPTNWVDEGRDDIHAYWGERLPGFAAGSLAWGRRQVLGRRARAVWVLACLLVGLPGLLAQFPVELTLRTLRGTDADRVRHQWSGAGRRM